ncbi:MAG: glycosyltransferase family 4 protein [Desulfobacterales bacterium]
MNPDYKTMYIGGESVQQSLIARAFAARGWEVTMIVKDHGQPDGEVIDGVRILKAYRPDAGMPVLRFIHPKVTSINRCLVRANADIYYHSCAGFITGLATNHCRRHGKRLVFRIAHDSDCIPGKQIIPTFRDRKIFEYGLRRADMIYAQSSTQMKLLRENYRLRSVFMPMAVELPETAESDTKDIDVLWVNNIRRFKRPELFIELSKQLPSHRFVMIGGPIWGMETYYAKIENEANRIDNLEFKGFVPYASVNRYFARSKIFVNTSDSEGFPNSYLQAWIRGVPVISFFDPDRLITTQGLGAATRDLHEMRVMVEHLLNSVEARSKLSERVRKYALTNHIPGSVAKKYEESFFAMNQ